MHDPRAASALASALRLVAGVALVAYPVFVWLGLSGLGRDTSPRLIAVALLAVVAPAAFLRLRRSGKSSLRGLAAVPLTTVAVLTAAAVLDATGWMLAVPVAINAVLLLSFSATLRRGAVPMVERFARLQEPVLTVEQTAWCRSWTSIWCVFFVLNGAAAAALAWLAPLDWWALYNGLLAYVLIGALLLGEWLLRRRRFPRTGDSGGAA